MKQAIIATHPPTSATPERFARPVALVSLRGEKEFRKVRAHGFPVRSALFTVRLAEYRPRYGETWRPRALVGIVVSKKTLKRAVDRNRVRRRVREALRTLPGGVSPCRAIVLPNPGVLGVPFAELQAALAQAFARAPGRAKRGGNPAGQSRVSEPVPSNPAAPKPEAEDRG